VSTPERYLELCELAECAPDGPWLAHPGDHERQVSWLWSRLANRGVLVQRREIVLAMDAFSSQ
jgi:hypothetical protein